jgi:hypothetical protein
VCSSDLIRQNRAWVLARSPLTAGSMQKSQPQRAVVPQPRNRGSLVPVRLLPQHCCSRDKTGPRRHRQTGRVSTRRGYPRRSPIAGPRGWAPYAASCVGNIEASRSICRPARLTLELGSRSARSNAGSPKCSFSPREREKRADTLCATRRRWIRTMLGSVHQPRTRVR